MGAPPYILKIINGYRIPFKAKPPLQPPHFQHQTPQSPEMSQIMDKMLKQGVLRLARSSPSFVSSIFLRAKSDGTSRPIFNLKRLNKFVHAGKFKLINVQRVPGFLQPHDWLSKIDLHQAYFHLPIAETHRRFLRLIYANTLLEMTCLPFGLSSAPKAFASLSNWIGQYLRRQGVRILIYLDDFLLVNQDPALLREHIQLALQTLTFLGWKINSEKSILTPQRALEFLGVIWDPWNNLKCLPDRLATRIESEASNMLTRGKSNLRDLQRIMGMMNFASFVVMRGRLHYRSLQAQSNRMLQLTKSTTLPISVRIRSDLNWWLTNCRRSSLIHPPPAKHYLTTDASDIGWGAMLDNLSLWGNWTPAQQHLHCNLKEMTAILNVLRGHGQLLSLKTLLIQSDNRTVVSYLRKEGGTKSAALMALTAKVLAIIDRFRIQLSIYHIPGYYNCHADHLSRKKAPPEWHLLPRITKIVFRKWGTPAIDLFASNIAHVVPKYCTLDRTDKAAALYDALSIEWHFPLAWVFPPPHLVPKVLAHMNNATGTFLVVAPRWKNVFWRPDLKSRALAPPFTIRNLSQVLVDATTGLPPCGAMEMTLEIWKCGGGTNT